MAKNNLTNALIGAFSLGVALTGDYVFSTWCPSRFFPGCTYELAVGVESIMLFTFTYWLMHRIFDEDETHEILVQDYEDHRRIKVAIPAADPKDSDVIISCDSNFLDPSRQTYMVR
jgi:hypothetical protein